MYFLFSLLSDKEILNRKLVCFIVFSLVCFVYCSFVVFFWAQDLVLYLMDLSTWLYLLSLHEITEIELLLYFLFVV